MSSPPRAVSADSDVKRRAPALSPENRRQMIVDAVVPLLAEHGADLTSRQIAEAAGVAEGTLFRAFGDKESLLRAAAERYFEEATGLPELRAIDPTWPLEVKLARVMRFMRRRFQGAIRVMAALDGRRPAKPHPGGGEATRLVTELFAADADRLTIPPRRIMHTLRLLAFASSVPDIAALDAPLTDEEVAHLLVNGITRDPSATPSEDGTDA